jgi:hypothetical protein
MSISTVGVSAASVLFEVLVLAGELMVRVYCAGWEPVIIPDSGSYI